MKHNILVTFVAWLMFSAFCSLWIYSELPRTKQSVMVSYDDNRVLHPLTTEEVKINKDFAKFLKEVYK